MSAAAVLGPPQMLSLVETWWRPFQAYWSTSHASCDPWFVCMCIQSQWAIVLMRNKIFVGVNLLMQLR